jgi:hypothetical protein
MTFLATGSCLEPVKKKSLPQGEKGGKDTGNSGNITKSGTGFAAPTADPSTRPV